MKMTRRILLPMFVAGTIAVGLLSPSLSTAQSRESVSALLRRVEDRYNHIDTLQASFSQTLKQGGRLYRPQTGVLYLRKPGKTFWEYTSDDRGFFLSDGKFTYDYNPSANEVTRTPFREDGDMRVPLAFLLGKLDFNKDFEQFRDHPEGENRVVEATPKNKKSPYETITMVIAPDASIRRVSIVAQDGTVVEYALSAEQRNPKLSEALFKFKAPAGARVLSDE